jgi:molecular chaperone GrpE
MSVKKKPILDKKLAEAEDKWKRALADYHNLEKRIVKEKESFVRFSNAQLWGKLLPIMDDLEAAEKHLKDQGLSLTLNKLKEVLKSEEVLEIKAQGEDFNPHLMEAVEMVEGPKDKVMEVLSKGYLLGEKVLRPAKVKVGQGQETKES